MHRFFCPPENINKENIVVRDSREVHHIVDVLRLKLNDKLIVFDGRGREYLGLIKEIKKNQIDIKIVSEKPTLEKNITITLACAIPKQGKFDYIVEKATELGVDKIVPLVTQRTIVSMDNKRKDSKLAHWRNVAISASKQCKRNFVPDIANITHFSDAISQSKDYDLCLFFCLEGDRKGLKDILKNFKKGKILIFIGPEGDFSKGEIDLARKSGCQFAQLGEFVLKVDTATISAVSILNFILSN